MKIVGAIFEKLKIFNFFLCELPLILRLDRKRKKISGDIYKGTSDTEFEQDWSIGLGATLGDRKLKTIIQFQGFFREKPIVSYCWDSNVQ